MKKFAMGIFASVTSYHEAVAISRLRTLTLRFHHRHLLTALAITILCTPKFSITAQLQSNSAEPLAGFGVVEATVDDVQAALRSGRVTCRGLVDLYLARIKSYDKSGPALNAI